MNESVQVLSLAWAGRETFKYAYVHQEGKTTCSIGRRTNFRKQVVKQTAARLVTRRQI